MKNFTVVFFVIILFVFLWWWFKTPQNAPIVSVPPSETQTSTLPSSTTMRVYANHGFSLKYPVGYTIDEKYVYQTGGPQKEIPGVSFVIPEAMTHATNLATDSHLSIEWLSNAQTCTAKNFLDSETTAPQTITDSGITYSVVTSTGAAAGNLYEETVYAFAHGANCYAVRYVIHSSNIGNYEPGTVKAFDREALIQEFDGIRHSLQFMDAN